MNFFSTRPVCNFCRQTAPCKLWFLQVVTCVLSINHYRKSRQIYHQYILLYYILTWGFGFVNESVQSVIQLSNYVPQNWVFTQFSQSSSFFFLTLDIFTVPLCSFKSRFTALTDFSIFLLQNCGVCMGVLFLHLLITYDSMNTHRVYIQFQIKPLSF